MTTAPGPLMIDIAGTELTHSTADGCATRWWAASSCSAAITPESKPQQS